VGVPAISIKIFQTVAGKGHIFPFNSFLGIEHNFACNSNPFKYSFVDCSGFPFALSTIDFW
jgi:hypothetical protein